MVHTMGGGTFNVRSTIQVLSIVYFIVFSNAAVGLSSSPTAASFVRSLKERDINTGVDFLHAVVAKYAPAPEHHDIVEISGKVVQEIGFDKISEMQSRLHELKYLVVDGEKIRRADPSLQPFPEVLELDLSRNLL